MSHVYVLDTNILIHNPNVIDELMDNEIVIPFSVIEELDDLKNNFRTGFAARKACNNIEKYRQKAQSNGKFLSSGIETDFGGILIIDSNGEDLSKVECKGILEQNKVDNRIIAVALHHQKHEKMRGAEGRRVIVLSKDTNVRIKASGNDLEAQDWEKDKLVKRATDIYTGIANLQLLENAPHFPANFFESRSSVTVEAKDYLHVDDMANLLPNQCLILKRNGDDKIVRAIYKKNSGKLIYAGKPFQKGADYRKNINPINDEQLFAFALCCQQDITMVSLMGQAGTGKTLMALLAGERLVNEKVYPKGILVLRSISTINEKELGFYKGTLDEKFAPYALPVVEAYEKVIGTAVTSNTVVDYDKQTVGTTHFKIQPILHQRGQTFDDTFVIIDEAQNLTPDEMVTLLTRTGVNTKVVLTGDIYQIDDKFLDMLSNGLTYAAELLKKEEDSAHITLINPERSEFVKRLLEILNG
ncbi:MAG: PhoH family protein [Patescibacteria group bacterium]